MSSEAKIGNVMNQDLRDLLGSVCHTSVGLAEGTNAHTLKLTRDAHYSIDGQAYYKAAADNIAMTACAAQAAETDCLYLVSLNAAGTLTVTKGTDDVIDELPATPASECAIGAFKVTTAVATTFTSGTTDLSAAGITATKADISVKGTSVPTFA